MNRYPEYIEVNNTRYKLNTDFRLALRCDEIFRDDSIGNYEKTLAIIYILLGEKGYIKASFMSDYKIDIDKIEMHWWQFYDLLQGLTDNSVLNRVRSIREESLSGKKGKERSKWEELKKQVELKREKTSYEKELDKFWEEQFKRE